MWFGLRLLRWSYAAISCLAWSESRSYNFNVTNECFVTPS